MAIRRKAKVTPPPKLTRADQKVLRQALDDALSSWRLIASNGRALVVRAERGDGDLAYARRRQRARDNRVAALEKAIAKLFEN